MAPTGTINPHFVGQVKKIASVDRPVVLICRSGQRSVDAGIALEQAGFSEVINVLEGFEGPLDERHQRSKRVGMAQGRPSVGADLNRAASRTPAFAPVEGALAAAFRDIDHPTIGEAQIRWYAERLPRDRGPVLITMAGSARLLIALAEQGFRVHGIDELASTVERCAATVAERGLDAPLFRQSLATLNLPFRYAAAIVAGESIQALEGRHRAVAALDRLRAHLVAPAMLLIEFSLPHAALHPTGAPAVEFSSIALADGSHILRRREISADAEARRDRGPQPIREARRRPHRGARGRPLDAQLLRCRRRDRVGARGGLHRHRAKRVALRAARQLRAGRSRVDRSARG